MAPFEKMRGRILVPWLIGGIVLTFVSRDLLGREWLEAHPEDPLPDALGILLTCAFLFTGPALQGWWAGLAIADLYGRFPPRRQVFQLTLLAFPMLGIAMAGSYLLFAPLSLVFPDAMQAWLFENVPRIYSAGAPYPWLGNVLCFVAVVIAAPMAEEWFVRGLLLNRWTHTVGTIRAVIRTSLLFALLHLDPLGAFIFGIVMCGLYARYRSLWAPTIVHAASNAVAWSLAVLDAHAAHPFELTSVVELREAWWLPIVGLLLVLPWALRLRGRYRPMASWEFAGAGAGDRHPNSGQVLA